MSNTMKERNGLNDDGDEDKDDDGSLVFPINTSTLEWIVLFSPAC